MAGEHRSGFASLVGRPNAGKSTLTNALVGSKVAITSSKPQTTRHAIRGLVQRPDAQLVIVDTPGLAQAADAAGGAAQRDRARDARRGRRGRLLRAGRPAGRPGRPLPGRRALAAEEPGAGASSPSPTLSTATSLAPSCWRSASSVSGPRSCRSAPSPGFRSSCSPTCWWQRLPEGPEPVSGRRAHRRAGGDPDRRAHPRGRARGRTRRAAAQHRRPGRGDGAAGGPHRTGSSTSTRRSTSSAPARSRSSSAAAAPG